MDRGLELRISEDPEQLAKAAGEFLVEEAHKAVEARGRWTVALSGGSTPERLYRYWGEPSVRDRMPWDKIHLFWGDERHVPPGHADSNYRMTRQALGAGVPIPEGNLHRICAEHADAEVAAEQYEASLKTFFGERPFPRFDLMLMGLGPDGHTASLFPGGDAVLESQRWVVAPYVPKLSTYRISLTVPVINAAELVLFLVAGSAKAPAVRAVLQDSKDPVRLPAQAVSPAKGRFVWWLDRAAAQDLPPNALEGDVAKAMATTVFSLARE